MSPPTADRRHTQEQVGFLFFGRYYSLAKIGAGLLFASSVIGVVAGCWSAAANFLGRRYVDDNAVHWQEAAKFDTASMVDRREIHAEVRSVDQRLIRVEDAVTMLTELKCRELRNENAPYLPPACAEILRKAVR